MKYQLQPYQGMASRFRCPACNHRTKTFTRYINTETNEAIAPHVGRCDRQDNCGYHLSPSQYFREAGLVSSWWRAAGNTQAQRKSGSRPPAPTRRLNETEYYISPDYVNDSFHHYDQNNFISYLIKRFGTDTASSLANKYRIGTSSYWHGATIFWQFDTTGHVRSGKVMLYDKQSGKRVKHPFNHITWVHTIIMRNGGGNTNFIPHQKATAVDFKLRQCLFGEHLLITSPYKPVAIVESEKTAIIASALMPAFIWLASGSLEGLNTEKCRILQNRQVILFPDVNAYRKWKTKASELRRAMPGTIIVVSDELERVATDGDRKSGADLGDVLK